MTFSIRRLAAAVLASVAIVACASDSPSHTAAPRTKSPDLLSGLIGMQGVQRTTPLASPITVTAVIGQLGGTLSIPAAGVTVTVPYGALSANTEITMTARAGALVAYDFSPHGITFAKPLVFRQSLKGTTASLLQAPLLKLGYYEDPSLLTETEGFVSQLLDGAVNLLTWTFTSTIPHFSGYMIGLG
jgi:hypothetical protein